MSCRFVAALRLHAGLVVWRGALAALLLAAGGGAWGASISVRDDTGKTFELASPPQRIVALLPSLSEGVCLLGGCSRLVAVDRYTNWPQSLSSLPRVGGLEDPQIEAIAELRPDLVLASRWARSLEHLEELGIPVLRLQAETHADVKRTLVQLATLLGRPDAAAVTWAGIERDMRAAAQRVPPAVRGQSVYFEIDAGPYAAGPGSFIGETLARLGLVNIVPPTMPRFVRLSPEFVIRAAPQWVMGAQASLQTPDRRPGWARLPAWQRHQWCSFAPGLFDMLIRPGPRMGEAARHIADCLAGEAP